jgi:HEPN domain-containing protein
MRKTRTLLYEHLCFHAQRAAEKALKAVLVCHGVRVPRSHDLAYLAAMLPVDVSMPVVLVDLPALTKYAVQQRYPGEAPPLTPKHRRCALQLAENAVAWAARRVRS